MVLAYGISLWMDWEKPYWAGLAVANCSLTSFGDSVQKGLLRLGGTALAVVVSLTLISLFPQDRWLFVGTLGACSYMMIGTSHFYFWQVAGFVVPILVVGGGANPTSDFQTVVLRAQQTALGVLCFSLVYALLWPSSSRKSFEDSALEFISLQRRLIASSLENLAGNDDRKELSTLRLQVTQRYSRLKSLLDAANFRAMRVDMHGDRNIALGVGHPGIALQSRDTGVRNGNGKTIEDVFKHILNAAIGPAFNIGSHLLG